jgi:uncharacterized linocin/CFP29 family protein
MNNLHRGLAPISDGAWAQIDQEAARTLKRYLGGRRVVDVKEPGGVTLAAVGTGHLHKIEAPGEGIVARQREVKSLVELRVPFELDRQAIDDVERGANDSDWQPLKEAAKRIAFAEDRVIFEGYSGGGIQGIRQGTSNPAATLPGQVVEYPNAIAEALSQLRLVGVNGPYSVVLGADAYTSLSEASDHGYPVIQHIQRLVNEEIIWAPAIAGAFVLTTPRRRLRLTHRPGRFDWLFEPLGCDRHTVPARDTDLSPADIGSRGSAHTHGRIGAENRQVAEPAARQRCVRQTSKSQLTSSDQIGTGDGSGS